MHFVFHTEEMLQINVAFFYAWLAAKSKLKLHVPEAGFWERAEVV